MGSSTRSWQSATFQKVLGLRVVRVEAHLDAVALLAACQLGVHDVEPTESIRLAALELHPAPEALEIVPVALNAARATRHFEMPGCPGRDIFTLSSFYYFT